jgi:hypothetical protein
MEARMRKTAICLLAVLAVAVPAIAQPTFTAGKISGTVHCAKTDPNYTVPVGDKSGHVLTLTEIHVHVDGQTGGPSDAEVGRRRIGRRDDRRVRPRHRVSHRDDGQPDKYAMQYTGSMTVAKDNSATLHGNWTIVGGTGKLVGIKGHGTYKCSGSPHGSGDVTVAGD